MTILYCLIANKSCSLAEHNINGDKKMSDIAHKLVKKLEFNQNSNESVEYETKTYSYRVFDEVVYICVTTQSFGKQ